MDSFSKHGCNAMPHFPSHLSASSQHSNPCSYTSGRRMKAELSVNQDKISLGSDSFEKHFLCPSRSWTDKQLGKKTDIQYVYKQHSKASNHGISLKSSLAKIIQPRSQYWIKQQLKSISAFQLLMASGIKAGLNTGPRGQGPGLWVG